MTNLEEFPLLAYETHLCKIETAEDGLISVSGPTVYGWVSCENVRLANEIDRGRFRLLLQGLQVRSQPRKAA